jgi:hypothetical protein
VREALDLRVAGDRDGADLAHAAEVVAREVDEHHVLRALLGIAGERGRQPLVLRRVRAAPDGAGDRPRLDRAAAAPHEHLRRRAENGRFAGLQVEEIGRGVERAQRAVDVERIRRERRRPPLGDHDLVDLALRDRLAGRGDVLEEAGARCFRDELRRGTAAPVRRRGLRAEE